MIFFDIDDTLTDSHYAHKQAIVILFEQYECTLQYKEYAQQQWIAITESYLEQYFRNEITLQQQRQQRLIDFWQINGRVLSEEKANGLYPVYHSLFVENCWLFDDVLVALEKIKHLKLGIISNGICRDQIFKLENNRIRSYFSTIVISEAVGFAKPGKEIFLKALDMAGADPARSFYVGNSYHVDYQGAHHAGLQAIWIDRLGENFRTLKKHQRCTSFSEAVQTILSVS